MPCPGPPRGPPHRCTAHQRTSIREQTGGTGRAFTERPACILVIAITRPSSATFLPRTPPSSYPIPTPYYSPVRPREDIPDARFLLRPTWVAPAREMPASCSPTRSFFRPPVVALGSHLAPLLAPSSPARRSGLATLPGQGAAVLGPTSPRRCRGEEGSSRGFRLSLPFLTPPRREDPSPTRPTRAARVGVE